MATGSPVTRYIHTDNLGSTNITSDTNQNRAQWFDYAPYGSVIASSNTGTTTDARQYIGQFSDASGLSYLNARYYNPTQGQFVTQDPVYLGNPSQQNLRDPQSLNAYSYSENNPINRSDPTGLYSLLQVASGQATWGQYWGDVNQGAMIMGQDPRWNFAFNHPYATGATVAALSWPALESGLASGVAFKAATFSGVGGGYAASQTFAGIVYAALAGGSLLGSIPDTIASLSGANFSQPSGYFQTAGSLATQLGPSIVGGYTSAFSDIYQLDSMLVQGAQTALGHAGSGGGSGSAVNAAVSGANNLNSLLNSGSLSGSAKQAAQSSLNSIVSVINPNKGKFWQ